MTPFPVFSIKAQGTAHEKPALPAGRVLSFLLPQKADSTGLNRLSIPVFPLFVALL
jgi:hypothetical protein